MLSPPLIRALRPEMKPLPDFHDLAIPPGVQRAGFVVFQLRDDVHFGGTPASQPVVRRCHQERGYSLTAMVFANRQQSDLPGTGCFRERDDSDEIVRSVRRSGHEDHVGEFAQRAAIHPHFIELSKLVGRNPWVDLKPRVSSGHDRQLQ